MELMTKKRRGPRPGVSFGPQLRESRDAVNLSGAELSRRVGINAGFYCRLEKGQGGTSPKIAAAIAREVGKSLRDLRSDRDQSLVKTIH